MFQCFHEPTIRLHSRHFETRGVYKYLARKVNLDVNLLLQSNKKVSGRPLPTHHTRSDNHQQIQHKLLHIIPTMKSVYILAYILVMLNLLVDAVPLNPFEDPAANEPQSHISRDSVFMPLPFFKDASRPNAL